MSIPPHDRLASLECAIEAYKVCPPLSDTTLSRIGALLIDGHGVRTINGVQLIREPDERQLGLIERAAEGDKTNEAATELGWHEAKVIEVREQLLAEFMAPAMSVVVDKSIVARFLPVTKQPTEVKLDRELDSILEAIRVGISNKKIGLLIGHNTDQIAKKIALLARHKLGGNGRTSTVLQAYSKGLRNIPTTIKP